MEKYFPGGSLAGDPDFSGGQPPVRSRSLAKKLRAWIRDVLKLLAKHCPFFKKWNKSSGNEKNLGRPTISDGILLGRRNAWQAFFEVHWADLGGVLLGIRDRRASTMDDVQKAFEGFEGRARSDIAAPLWRGSCQSATGPELRRNRIKLYVLHGQIQGMEAKHGEQQRLHSTLTVALEKLKDIDSDERRILQEEADRQKASLFVLEVQIFESKTECNDLDNIVKAQDAFFYRSELLDLLKSRRCTVDPRSLAAGLAGLSEMKWRQSRERCASVPVQDFVHFPYRLLLVMMRIWARKTCEFQEAPIDFYRVEILKLADSDRDIKECVCRNWRDFRLAIEECWGSGRSALFSPSAVASSFMRRMDQQKNLADQILDSREALPLPPERH
jgi:hypothetical protein